MGLGIKKPSASEVASLSDLGSVPDVEGSVNLSPVNSEKIRSRSSRPSSASSVCSSRLSDTKRERLQRLLDKEELKDDIVKRMQVENPAIAKDADLFKAADIEATKMVGYGEGSRPGTAQSWGGGSLKGSVKGNSRPASRGGASVAGSSVSEIFRKSAQRTKSVKEILKTPSTPESIRIAEAARRIAQDRAGSSGRVKSGRSPIGEMEEEEGEEGELTPYSYKDSEGGAGRGVRDPALEDTDSFQGEWIHDWRPEEDRWKHRPRSAKPIRHTHKDGETVRERLQPGYEGMGVSSQGGMVLKGGANMSTQAKRAAKRQQARGSNAQEDTVAVPVFTVAGKRASLEELLREKMQQKVRGGNTSMRDQFNTLDRSRAGRVDVKQLQRFLANYNINIKVPALKGVMRFYDRDSDGTIDYHEFLRHVLQEDYPMDRRVVPQTTAFASAFERAREKVPTRNKDLGLKQEESIVGADMVEGLLREKIGARTGGPDNLKAAFRHFDQDKDGKISIHELQQVFEKFHLKPHQADVQALMDRYDKGGKGYLDYYDFAERVVPPDYPSRGVTKDHAIVAFRKIRERVKRQQESMRRAFQRHDVNGMLDQKELKAICHEENIDVDEKTLAFVMEQCSSTKNGKLSYEDFVTALECSEDMFGTLQAHRPDKHYLEGFGMPRTTEHRDKHAPKEPDFPVPLSLPQIENMLREKVTAKSNGLAHLRKSFAHFDRRSEGFITRGDLRDVLSQFNMRVSEHHLDALMRKYDLDQDGKINWTEFVERLIQPAYTGREQASKTAATEKVQSQFSELARALGRRDRGLHRGVLREYLPSSDIMQACHGAGVKITREQLKAIVDQCDQQDGKADYLHFLTVLKSIYAQSKMAKIEEAVKANPKGLIERLACGDPRNGPVPPRVPAFPQKMSMGDLERLLREKIELKGKGGTAALWDAFRHFNPGQRGFISRADFGRVLSRAFQINIPESDMHALFNRYDRDGDGAIDFHEFVGHLIPASGFEERRDGLLFKLRNKDPQDWGRLRDRMHQADKNQTGSLDIHQLRRVCRLCRIDMEDNELQGLLAEADDGRGHGTGDVDQLASVMRAWKVRRAHQEDYNGPPRRVHSPTARAQHTQTAHVEMSTRRRLDSRRNHRSKEEVDPPLSPGRARDFHHTWDRVFPPARPGPRQAARGEEYQKLRGELAGAFETSVSGVDEYSTNYPEDDYPEVLSLESLYDEDDIGTGRKLDLKYH